MQTVRLDPAQLHESGNTPTFIPLVANGSGEGYWMTESGARWKWTGNATRARVRLFSTSNPNPYSQPTYPNVIPFRVNGYDRLASSCDLGDGWYDADLGLGWGKTVELFVPVANIISFNGPIVGSFPMAIEFNDVMTPVAPSSTGTHRLIYGDSITTGMDAASAILQGYAGTMKRGTSDLVLPSTSVAGLPRYKGAYSAGTTYAVNDVVSYTLAGTPLTWRKTSAAAAGTTPAVGADWECRGFGGKVTTVAHGTRRLYDDANTSGLRTAFAAFLASLNPTEILFFIGTNDQVFGWSAASFQTAATALLNALAGTSASAVPVRWVTPLISGWRETANAYGNTMDDYRAAISAAVAATSKSGVSVVNGKTILNISTDFADGLHPTTAGHMKLRQALL